MIAGVLAWRFNQEKNINLIYNFMQAIQIKYLPATNIKGARLKATCEGGSIIEAKDYSIY